MFNGICGFCYKLKAMKGSKICPWKKIIVYIYIVSGKIFAIYKLRKFTQGTIILIIDSCPLIFGIVSTNYEEFGYSLPIPLTLK